MSQLGDYEDMVMVLEGNLTRRKPSGQGLSIDADFILKSFGEMKCMDFVFGIVDPGCFEYDKDFCERYPLYSKYLNELEK